MKTYQVFEDTWFYDLERQAWFEKIAETYSGWMLVEAREVPCRIRALAS